MKLLGTSQRQTQNHFHNPGLMGFAWKTNPSENELVIKNYKPHRETGCRHSREWKLYTVTWDNKRK